MNNDDKKVVPQLLNNTPTVKSFKTTLGEKLMKSLGFFLFNFFFKIRQNLQVHYFNQFFAQGEKLFLNSFVKVFPDRHN